MVVDEDWCIGPPDHVQCSMLETTITEKKALDKGHDWNLMGVVSRTIMSEVWYRCLLVCYNDII